MYVHVLVRRQLPIYPDQVVGSSFSERPRSASARLGQYRRRRDRTGESERERERERERGREDERGGKERGERESEANRTDTIT